MTITQTVEIPADYRIFLDLPHELPIGKAKVELTVTPVSSFKKDLVPISRYFDIISPNTYGDGVAYQRKIRDEWSD